VNDKKLYAVLLVVLIIFFTGCKTTSEEKMSEPAGDINLILQEISAYPNDVYAGISGIYSNQEKMMGAALMDAAKKVLIHDLVIQKTQTYGESNTRYSIIEDDNHITYTDSQLVSIVKSLDVIDIIFDENLGCVVIAKAQQDDDDFIQLEMNDGVPKWVTDEISIPSYIVGIGTANSHSTVKSSIEAADYSAVDELFSKVSDVDGYAISNQVMTSKYYNAKSYQGSLGSLEGVKIISRYYDKLNNKYYSLAIVKMK